MAKYGVHAGCLAALLVGLMGCGGGGSSSDAGAAPDAGPGPGAAASYRVGGTAQGLSGAGLMLLNNGSERLAVPANGSFGFPTALAGGASFSVSIDAQPSGQLCSVSNGSGSVVDRDVASVGVTCTTVGADAGAEYGSGPDPIAAMSSSPGSGDLIRAAVGAGTLSEEQALLYALYAEYADPRLPAQFVGDDVGILEGTAHRNALEHIAKVGLANVSQATLDALKPFFIPAHQEGSYQRASVGAHDKAALTAKRPHGSKAGWTGVPGKNVIVWYETSRAAADGANAAMLVAEFDTRIWPMLTGLMGRTPKSDLGADFWRETDGRLDITLDDIAGTAEGRTTPVGWSAEDTAVSIALSRKLSPQGLQAQAAHEFMHAIQYAIDVKAFSVPYYATILEATAAWASHYVYPLNGWETSYAPLYLQGGQFANAYDSPRNAHEKQNLAFRYGAYVLPLFLQTRFGPGIVKAIWDATVSESFEMDAINKAIVGAGSTFEDEWRKFIAFCWNQETLNDATRLYQAAKLPFTAAPDNPARDLEEDLTLSLSNGFAAAHHAVDLPHASMAFYRVRFAASDSRSVTFVNGLTYGLDTFDSGVGNALRFTGVQPGRREGASMQLYLKVNGAWQSAPVDVTNVPFIAICRDNPAGKVEEVVFMYGNGEVDRGDPNYTGLQVPGLRGPGLIATDIGCRDWTGQLDMKRPVEEGTGQETFTLKNVTLTNAMSTAAPQPGAKVPYALAPGEQFQPGFGFVYKVTGGTAEWTYQQRVVGPTTCDYAGAKTYPVTGSAGPAPGPLPVLTLSNYAPPGNTYRSLITVGLAINALADFVSLTADWTCTDSDGKVTKGTQASIAKPLDLLVTELTASARVGAGGLRISGTGAQTQAAEDGDTTVTGTWSLTAVP